MARLAGIILALRELREVQIEKRLRQRYARARYLARALPDAEFVKNYRITRTMFEELCSELIPMMNPKKSRQGIDPALKILTVLKFYAYGSYQGQVGNNNDAPMAQQTVSRCLHQVTNAFNTSAMIAKYLKFPRTARDRQLLKQRFKQKYSLEDVLGVIDCFHISIIKPRDNSEHFYSRKSQYSINCQAIMDADCRILDVDISQGWAEDAFIWNCQDLKSQLKEFHDRGERNVLLGDLDYPLQPNLITPYKYTIEGSPEENFNILHDQAMEVARKTFAALKGRWRCLLSSKELSYAPQMASKIATACCILHNKCNSGGKPPYPALTEAELIAECVRALPDTDLSMYVSEDEKAEGVRVRDDLVQILQDGPNWVYL